MYIYDNPGIHPKRIDYEQLRIRAKGVYKKNMMDIPEHLVRLNSLLLSHNAGLGWYTAECRYNAVQYCRILHT